MKIESKATGGASRHLKQKTDLIISVAIVEAVPAHSIIEHRDEVNESFVVVRW